MPINWGQHAKTTAISAGLGAVATAGVAAAGPAIQHIYNAMTKKRDFNSMMQSPFNADLHEHASSRPKEFNAAFSSLRTMTPEMTKDPMISGQYMRRMMVMSPDTAGGTLLEALERQGKMAPNMVMEAFGRGAGEGAKAGLGDSMRGQQAEHQSNRQQAGALSLEEAKHRMGLEQGAAAAGHQLRNMHEMEETKQQHGAGNMQQQHENQMRLEGFKKHIQGMDQGDLEQAHHNPSFR